jgi:hypothetical protein
MRNTLVILLASVSLISTLSFAQNGGYVLADNDNPNGNSVTAFKVTAAGKLSLFKTLDTGGFGIGGGYFLSPRVAIESNAHCVFVADAGSNDIAAFEGPSFNRITPNFTNPQLNAEGLGMGLAVDPAGKFLYSAWAGSENIAVLAIASDCSLTLVGSPIAQPDEVVDLSVTRDGRVLVVSYPNVGGAQAYKTSSAGALTPLGPQLIFASVVSQCSQVGCFPAGLDATDDGQYWVWGNATFSATTLSATLTTKGFINAALQTYPDTTLTNVEQPWFSPAAAKTDNGNLYLAASGFGAGYPAGIIVDTFDKGTITYANDLVNTLTFEAGPVVTIGTTGTGSPLVQMAASPQANNILSSYGVSGTTLTLLGSLDDKAGAGGLAFSIAAFPVRP